MNCKAAITENFAGAIQGDQLTKRVNAILEERGFTPENTLFANSTCPDEINRFVTSFEQYWGENFPLGGLAGLPFTGVTGFGAYSHHVPDGGNLFIGKRQYATFADRPANEAVALRKLWDARRVEH